MMHMLGPGIHDEIPYFLAFHLGENLPVGIRVGLSEVNLDLTGLRRPDELP